MKLLKRLDLAYSRALTGLRRGHMTPSMRGVGELMWEMGRAAGRREANKRNAVLLNNRKKLSAALREAGLQHERYRKAEHEMNIVRLRNERSVIELRRQFERRIAEERQLYARRVAMLETRMPSGGFCSD